MKLFAAITGSLLILGGLGAILAGLVGAGDNARVGSSGLHGWECEAQPADKKEVCEWTGPTPGEMVSPVVQVLAGGGLTLAGSILLAAPVLAGRPSPQPAPTVFAPPPMGPPMR